jgi:hypothetical protein
MRFSLLLLLLPLHSFAQFNRSYTGPTMQQNQQSRDYFNRTTNQRTQDFQQRQLERSRYRMSNTPVSREVSLQTQAKQQKSEQEANESLARLVQQQQQQRQEHPAKNAQQAAAQQKADNQQLTLLAVKNYREVFLPGQVASALDAQHLAPGVQQRLQKLTDNLLDDTWWSKQEGAQLTGKIKACGDSLTLFTTSLLGFNLASPPATPAAFSAKSFETMLAKDAFDQSAATRLIQDAALTERLAAGSQLAKAAQEFGTLTASAAASPAQPVDAKKLRKDVQKSLRALNKELTRYDDRIAASDKVSAAEQALRKSATTYLLKNDK